MANKRRVFRVAERIRDVVAMDLMQVADPRLNLVTITSVMVTPDLRLAKVYWVVSTIASEDVERRKSEVGAALESAAGFLKRGVGRALNVKFVPELRFYYDDTLDEQDRITDLFQRVKDADAKRNGES